MVTRPEHEHVTFAEVHAFGNLARLQFGRADRVTGLQPFDTAEPRNVQEDAAANEACRIARDVVSMWPSTIDALRGPMPVVDEPVIRHVA